MEAPSGSGDADARTTTLLRLAAQLRQAAVDLDRDDVVTRVDELIVLIAGGRDSADGKAGAVIRFLDGLGF
jgi:hypothetical protein